MVVASAQPMGNLFEQALLILFDQIVVAPSPRRCRRRLRRWRPAIAMWSEGRHGQPHRPRAFSTAFTTVDLDRPGKQLGFVMIPHSPHDDAWGVTRLPLAVISHGSGRRSSWRAAITATSMRGRSSSRADPGARPRRDPGPPHPDAGHQRAGGHRGQRTSPIDTLNLNRSFPGDPHGSMTQQIAAFMADEIYPRGDAFLDLHSGGSSLDLLPSAIIEPTEDGLSAAAISPPLWPSMRRRPS
jgi:Predicted deacylase